MKSLESISWKRARFTTSWYYGRFCWITFEAIGRDQKVSHWTMTWEMWKTHHRANQQSWSLFSKPTDKHHPTRQKNKIATGNGCSYIDLEMGIWIYFCAWKSGYTQLSSFERKLDLVQPISFSYCLELSEKTVVTIT